MGQRHQLFVIARINGKYQCIVALHHQWLYGTLPLQVAGRFMDACRCNIFNTLSIAADLNRAADVQASGETLICKDTPCPLIGCFLWDATIAAGSPALMNFLPYKMGSRDGDNNDGITVLDITNPQYPKYCFVSVSGLECDEPQPELLTPLTAEEYLRSYYPRPDNVATPEEQEDELDSEEDVSDLEEEDVWNFQEDDQVYQELIDAFKDFGVIEIGQLAEVWPHEYKVQSTDSVVDQVEAAIQDPLVDIASLSQLSLEVLYDTAGEWPPAEHVLEIGGRTLAGHFDVSSGVFDIGDLNLTLRSLVRTADFLIAGRGRIGDFTYYLDMSRFRSDTALSAADIQSVSDAFPNLKCINLIGCNQVAREVIEEHYENNSSSPLLLNYAELSTGIKFLSGVIHTPMRIPARSTVIVRMHSPYRGAIRTVIFGCPYLHVDAAIASATEAITRFGSVDVDVTIPIIAWKMGSYSGPEVEPGVRSLSTSFPARIIPNGNPINTGWAFFLDARNPYTTAPKYAFVNLAIATEDNSGFTVENFVE